MSAPDPAGLPLSRPTRTSTRPLKVELQRAVRTWTPAAREVRQWAEAALGPKGRGHEISVRVVGPAESRQLNGHYRGRDKPTNVLSFPAVPLPAAQAGLTGGPVPLGDLVICAAVVKTEAQEQGKALRAHWAHLVVHGTLHLVGHDHENEPDAVRMERREIRVLRGLGFPNPYGAR